LLGRDLQLDFAHDLVGPLLPRREDIRES